MRGGHICGHLRCEEELDRRKASPEIFKHGSQSISTGGVRPMTALIISLVTGSKIVKQKQHRF